MHFLSVLLAIAVSQVPGTPVVKKINGYTITVRARPGDRYDKPSSTVVKDRQGKVIFSAKDYDTGIVWVKDLAGDGVPVVAISTYTGGAHCCETDYFLRLGATPKIVGKYEMGNVSGIEPKRRKGKKGFDVFTDFDGFAYYQSAYANSPHMPMMFRYQDGHLVEATKDFPAVLKARFKDSKKALLESIGEWEQEVVKKEASGGLIQAGFGAPAIEMVALSSLLGNRAEADDFLRAKLTVADFEKLGSLRKEIEEIVASRVKRMTWPSLPIVHSGMD